MKTNIFCPNCAAGNKIEQNYCRFCGLNLQETASALLKQFESKESARRFDKLKLIKKLSDAASLGLIFVIAAGALFYIYLISMRMILSGERIFFGIVLVIVIFQFALKQIKRVQRGGNKNEETKATPKERENKETKKLLEDKPFEPAAIVAENSTELLFAENKTKRVR